jgi:predicted transcriptional regulator
MDPNAVLFSIRPRHAHNIFQGKKTVELRRVKPKKLRNGSIVIVYVSSPQQTLSGAFKVAEVVQRPLQELWELVKDKAGISKEEYDEYFSGSHQGVAIFISEVLCLTNPIKLRDLRARILNFNPPQSFRYTNLEEINIPLLQNTIL